MDSDQMSDIICEPNFLCLSYQQQASVLTAHAQFECVPVCAHPRGRLSLLHLLLFALTLRLCLLPLIVTGLRLHSWHGGGSELRLCSLLTGRCGWGAGIVMMYGSECDGGRAAVLLKAIQIPETNTKT